MAAAHPKAAVPSPNQAQPKPNAANHRARLRLNDQAVAALFKLVASTHRTPISP